jgi:hypothetical protein
MRHAISTLVAIALIASPLSAVPPADRDAVKLLIGSWAVPNDEYSGGFTFRADGTYSMFGVFRVRYRNLRVDAEGKWSIKNGILIEEVTKSSPPETLLVGTITRDTLLSVTDKEYRYRTEQGAEQSRVRK